MSKGLFFKVKNSNHPIIFKVGNQEVELYIESNCNDIGIRLVTSRKVGILLPYKIEILEKLNNDLVSEIAKLKSEINA
jgi:hypothetical protein